MPQAKTELIVIDRFYEFLIWSCRHVAKFPRDHKFTVGDRLAARLNDTLEQLIEAKYTSDRLQLLRDANRNLEVLRFQFRVAKDLQCLSIESYGFASRSINEVGQLLGGWIKHAKSVAGRSPT